MWSGDAGECVYTRVQARTRAAPHPGAPAAGSLLDEACPGAQTRSVSWPIPCEGASQQMRKQAPKGQTVCPPRAWWSCDLNLRAWRTAGAWSCWVSLSPVPTATGFMVWGEVLEGLHVEFLFLLSGRTHPARVSHCPVSSPPSLPRWMPH